MCRTALVLPLPVPPVTSMWNFVSSLSRVWPNRNQSEKAGRDLTGLSADLAPHRYDLLSPRFSTTT